MSDFPQMHVLIGPYAGTAPIRCEIAENDAGTYDRRAHRPCPCGDGTLFDWGCGSTRNINFISWHCNRCPNWYTEYVSLERLNDIRQGYIGRPITASAGTPSTEFSRFRSESDAGTST